MDFVGNLGSTIVERLADCPEVFLSWVEPVLSGLASALGSILDQTSSWLASAADSLDFSSWVERFLGWVEQVVPSLLSRLGELVASVAQALAGGSGEIEGGLSTWLNSFLKF